MLIPSKQGWITSIIIAVWYTCSSDIVMMSMHIQWRWYQYMNDADAMRMIMNVDANK